MGRPYLLKNPPNVWLAVLLPVGIVLLHALDDLATVYWSGFRVSNPFMAYILEYDTTLFIAVRTVGIAAVVGFLAYLTRKRYALALIGLLSLLLASLYPLAVHIYMYAHTSLA